MNMHSRKVTVLIVPLALLAGAAFGQVSQVTNATTNATANAANAATASAVNSTANVGSNVGASVNSSVNGAAGAAASAGSVNSGVSASVQTPSASMSADSSASFGLDVSDTLRSVNSAAFSARDGVVADVHSRYETSQKSLDAIEKRGKHLEGRAKADFKAAVSDAKEKGKELNHSIRAAKKASAEEWNSARSDLASRYDAYAQAMAKADAQAAGSAAISR